MEVNGNGSENDNLSDTFTLDSPHTPPFQTSNSAHSVLRLTPQSRPVNLQGLTNSQKAHKVRETIERAEANSISLSQQATIDGWQTGTFFKLMGRLDALESPDASRDASRLPS
jgi:hypothetical protein